MAAGDIRHIGTKRDTKYADITLPVSTIEYITYKKDGRFFQPFSFEEELETPLVLTGDCLERIENKHLEEGVHQFAVYEKAGEEYVLNEQKQLELTLLYDFEEDVWLTTSVQYAVTVPNATFEELKRENARARKQKKSRGRK